MSQGSGLIVMWSGLIANIPNGWLLCDGTSGTPDLREKFIRGPADGIDPGGGGGASSHDHDFTADPHDHTLPLGPNISAGGAIDAVSATSLVTGITDSKSSLPPYFELVFLMKS